MGSTPANQKQLPSYILTAVLWLLAAGLGLAAIYYLQDLTLGVYVLLGGNERGVAGVLRNAALLMGGLIWIVAIVGCGEYLLKHAGERKAWIVSAWIIGIELAIILLAFVLS